VTCQVEFYITSLGNGGSTRFPIKYPFINIPYDDAWLFWSSTSYQPNPLYALTNQHVGHGKEDAKLYGCPVRGGQ
jgi:hypothetical protein